MRELSNNELGQVHGGLSRFERPTISSVAAMAPDSALPKPAAQINGPLMADWAMEESENYGVGTSESDGSSTQLYTGSIPGTDIALNGYITHNAIFTVTATDPDTGLSATNNYNISSGEDDFDLDLDESDGNWSFAVQLGWNDIGTIHAFNSFSATATYHY